ncbi:uncharacterized protein LOC111054515 isoform X2 [Nilaparvata lugens]|uniref:uncharacterized protein LOC111054515 isoform X2 n=1 Tax=Nilaparvata lugens TaxID=108931 RepID=UPI00193E28A2|nr:uncharacterized protein LOC111054515 isoform X2 [Nilaparvata lugens]
MTIGKVPNFSRSHFNLLCTRSETSHENVELIPTRTTKVATSKPAANPLQFIKVGPCNLYRSAQEQLKKVEEVKKVKKEVRDDAEDWQSNLDNWKCSRRKKQEHIIERVVEVKKLELEEHDRNRRRSKTFSEMMEERGSRGRKMSLPVYQDDDNDLSDLGISKCASARDNDVFDEEHEHNGDSSDNHDETNCSRVKQNGTNGHKDEELSRTSSETEEYTYEGAIQSYRNFTETRVKSKSCSNSSRSSPEENGAQSYKRSPPVPAKPRRGSTTKIEAKLSELEQLKKRSMSTTDLSSGESNRKPVVVPKVDINKRRELFEKSSDQDDQVGKVSRLSGDFTNSKSIRERLSSFSKQSEESQGKKKLDRVSSEVSVRDRLSSIERQQSTENLSSVKQQVTETTQNSQSVRERLNSLEKSSNKEPVKSVTTSPIRSVKEEVEEEEKPVVKCEEPCRVAEKIVEVTTTNGCFVNEKQVENVSSDIERISSPEEEMYGSKRQQHFRHRSLDSLDVDSNEGLGNECFERVQSLEDLDFCRNYPASSMSGDTDREDSGIHTADVSSSVSQADDCDSHLDSSSVDTEFKFQRQTIIEEDLRQPILEIPPTQLTSDTSCQLPTSVSCEDGSQVMVVSSSSTLSSLKLSLRPDHSDPLPVIPESPSELLSPSEIVISLVTSEEVEQEINLENNNTIEQTNVQISTEVTNLSENNTKIVPDPKSNLETKITVTSEQVVKEIITDNNTTIEPNVQISTKVTIPNEHNTENLVSNPKPNLETDIVTSKNIENKIITENKTIEQTNVQISTEVTSSSESNTNLVPNPDPNLETEITNSVNTTVYCSTTPSQTDCKNSTAETKTLTSCETVNLVCMRESKSSDVTDDRRRTVVEVCEKVDCSEVASPLPTPVISVEGFKFNAKEKPMKEDLKPIKNEDSSMNGDWNMCRNEKVTSLKSEVLPLMMNDKIEIYNDIEECKRVTSNSTTNVELVQTVSVCKNEMMIEDLQADKKQTIPTVSTVNDRTNFFIANNSNKLPELNMNVVNGELEGGGGAAIVFPLSPSALEPPKEKPPPPPAELSDDDDSSTQHKPSALRRLDSTKRIKKEIRLKRSSFLGLEGGNDDSLEPDLDIQPPPDMTTFLQEERRLEQMMYRQSICSESDSNQGESRDSGVELDRGHHDDISWPEHNHSRNDSETFGNNSSTSEEEENTKKEREVNERNQENQSYIIAAQQEQNNIGEKLALRLRELEAEKTRLEWEREEEMTRRKAEEAARCHQESMIQAREEELRKQESVVNSTDEGSIGDSQQQYTGELLISERERLEREQEELSRQRETLVLQQQWAASLQDVSQPTAAPVDDGHPSEAVLDYRRSMPNLQQQDASPPPPPQPLLPSTRHSRPPPPIPPAKPLVIPRTPLQEKPVKRTNSPQQMTRQTLQALSAAPRSRLIATDTWMKRKPKQDNQNNNNYNYQHWLIQEAEHRRITELQQRQAAVPPKRPVPPHPSAYPVASPRNSTSTTSSVWQQPPPPPQSSSGGQHWASTAQPAPQPPQWVASSPPQRNDKPLPDEIIQTLTQRVQNRINNNHLSAAASINNGLAANNNRRRHEMNSAQLVVDPQQRVMQLKTEPQQLQQEKMLSVSGKKKCSHCGDELGRGAAMIIETLRLFYHIDCFKCCVCCVQLGDGLMGTDVRVRNNKLHCHNCYSSDDGVKFSCV